MKTPPAFNSGSGAREHPCAQCQTSLPISARFCGKCGARVMRDFFISYNHNDQGWAEWIAWHLEAAGYTTLIQAWDIRPGSNFIVEMDQAFKTTHRTIAILSPDYLTSQYTTPEWANALLRDPTGTKRVLVPVRVRECQPEGWLAAVVYVDLLGQPQQEARKRLLEGIQADGRSTLLPTLPIYRAPAYPASVVALWNVPYRRNPYFIGREETLEQVHAAFTAKPGIVTQALTGLSGIGKTQTALEYAYRYQQEYQAIFWVQSETHELLIGDFLKIATLLQLPECDVQEQAVIVTAVTHWLETQSGWLLVVDNVADAGLARDLLPTRGSGHVLLTARAQVLGALNRTTSLSALPTEEAARFLLRRANRLAPDVPLEAAPPEQQAQARSIAEALGGLTLALDQAGAYIEETGCDLEGYLSLFQTRRTVLMGSRGTDAQGHPEPVAVTWSVAFGQVEQASPAAADLLRLCAFLHPKAIPEDLFRDGVWELTPALQEAVNDPLQWNTALAALRRFSLVVRQTETRTLSVHRLVQAVLQDALPDDEQHIWAERSVRLVSTAFPSVGFETWERCQQLLPHALACADHIEAWHLISSEAAYLLNQAGYYLQDRAQYAEALPLYQRALAIDERVLGSGSPDMAKSLNNLAFLYQIQGQYVEALPLYQQALKIFEQAQGSEHPDVAQSLSNLATLYLDQGQYAYALSCLQRAQIIQEQMLGPTHPSVATGLNNLAELYRVQEQYAEALPLAEQALAIWKQTLGPAHPKVAVSLNNLALLYYAQRRYAEALPLYQQAMEIDEQAYGSNHPDVATDLNNLAELHRIQGRYTEALSCLQQALAILEQTLPDHPNTAICLESMAALLCEMGLERKAREFIDRAQDIRARCQTAGR